IRSKTKFWQIIGRGTRLCPDLFGPGEDKEFFRVFDYCQNLEFFRQNPQPDEGKNARSLNERLFAARFDLVRALDDNARLDVTGMAHPEQEGYDAGEGLALNENAIRGEALNTLRIYVAAMNFDNFIVRGKRRAVEKYKSADAWNELTDAVRD